MRIKDVKLGQHYALYSQQPKLLAVSWGHSCGQRTVQLTDGGGHRFETDARHLTPWDEFMGQLEMEQQEAEEMERLAERLTDGKGKVQAEPYYRDLHHLRFDEEAAEALLTGLGRKPLSDNCRPSNIKDQYEREEAQLRLARRIRHALKDGVASTVDIELVDSSGMDCQIEISLLSLSSSVDFLKGSNDALSDILGHEPDCLDEILG